MKPEKSLLLKQIGSDLNPNLMKIHDCEHIPDFTWVTEPERKAPDPKYDSMAKISRLRVWAYDIHGNRFELSTLRPIEFHTQFDNDFSSYQEFDFNGPHIENLIRENQE